MKLFFSLALLLFVSQVIIAQNIGINSTGATPNDAAMLDIDVSALVAKKGLLIPRVTAAQKIAMDPLAAPAQGLLIYQTDGVEGFYYNTSNTTTPSWAYLLPNNGASGGWGLSGNAGTVDGTNFIGTTDNVPLNFRVNNQKAGRIDVAKKNIFFGSAAGNSNTTGTNNVGIGDSSLFNNINGYYNVGIGKNSLHSNTSGVNNTSIGSYSLHSNTTGSGNTANGGSALYSNTIGNSNTATGSSALVFNISGEANTANGASALSANQTGHFNTAIGVEALNDNITGSSNTAIGAGTLSNNSNGNDNSSLGAYTMQFSYSGNSNTAIGNYALHFTNGSKNTALGDSAGYNHSTGSLNTFIGYYAHSPNFSSLVNATAIGANSNVTASNSLVLGNNANVGIGTTAPTEKLEVVGKTKTSTLQVTTGASTGNVLTSDASGNATWQSPSANSWALTGNSGTVDGTNFIGTTDDVSLNFKVNNQKAGRIENSTENTFIGYQTGIVNTGFFNSGFGYHALSSNTTGMNNTAIGTDALRLNSSGSSNTATGFGALDKNTIGFYNTANGSTALDDNTTGHSNTATGVGALGSNTTGYLNTASGSFALYNNIWGRQNTASGDRSLINNLYGSLNTAVGDSAGYGNTTGSSNTYIGYQANGSATISNATAIGANASVTASNSMVLGNNVNVGIGTTAPTEKLDVIGKTKTTTLQVTTGATTGNVLTSDASGNATWQANGNGTVTSIALAMPSLFSVSGSPVTSSGTITTTLANQNANTIFAGPSTGVASAPTFRALVAADIPSGSTNYIQDYTVTNNFATGQAASFDITGDAEINGTLKVNGNVGIGLTAPLSKMDIRSANVTTASATPGILNVMSNNAQGADIGASISLGGFNDNAASVIRVFGSIEGRKTNGTTATSSGYLSFKTNNGGVLNENMRIDNTGSVGIGTTTPLAKEHVVGEILSGPSTLTNTTGHGTGAITAAGASACLNFLDRGLTDLSLTTTAGNRWAWYSAGGTARLFTGTTGDVIAVTSTGNVGIGSAPGFKLQVGTSGDGTVARANSWTVFSDSTLKKDVTLLANASDKLNKVSGYYYYWKTGKDTSKQVGFIAQEIERILPEIVSTDSSGIKSVDYSKMTPLLLQAIKEQQQTIEEDKKKISNMEIMMEALNKRLSALENSNTLTVEAKK